MSGRTGGTRSRAGGGPPRVAYLVSQYPAVSHTFVEREIVALRALGVQVATFTIRAAPPSEQLTPATRLEGDRTVPLVGHPARRYLGALARVVRASPTSLIAAWWAAVRSGAPTVRSKIWQQFYLAEALLLVDEMRRREITHVHVHHANNAADIARLAVVLGRRLDTEQRDRWRWTLSMHGATEFFHPVRFDLAAKVRSAAVIACISEYCRGELLRVEPGADRATMAIVRMGVDTQVYRPPDGGRPERPPGHLRVLYVGRMVESKGLLELVGSVRDLIASGRTVTLMVAGTGPLEAVVRRIVTRYGLEAYVTLQGAVGQDRLPAMYHWADVHCLPSHAEGVPVVLMEAMATELPVVSTRIAGIPELVTERESGLLIEPGSARQLTASLAELADNPRLRAEMGARGRRRVLADFQPGPNALRLATAFGFDVGAPTCGTGSAGPAASAAAASSLDPWFPTDRARSRHP